MELQYCSGTPPPSELIAAKFLNSLEENTFESLVEAATSSFNNVESKSITLSLKSKLTSEEYERTFHTVKNIISKCVKKNLESSTISNDLHSIGLNKVYATMMAEKIGKVKLDGVVEALKGNKLLEIQWKFGLASSGSEGSQHTFINLYLTIGKKDGKKERIEIELTLPQFYKFLHSIEKARSLMNRYSIQ